MRTTTPTERIAAAFLGQLLLLWGGCSGPQDSVLTLDRGWMSRIDSLNEGLSKEWYAPEHVGTGWENVTLVPYTERHEVIGRNGITWFRTTFHARSNGDSARILFHGSDNSAEVWLNGVSVGGVRGYAEWFATDVTPALRDGLNTLVVRVNDPGGYGGMYGPVTLITGEAVEDGLREPWSTMSARRSADAAREAVVYCALPRAFGTFRDIEQRLPEIKNLGASILWLLPVHPIGDANRKGLLGNPYAVRDYYAMNPELGTLEDFRSLIGSAHALGLKVIMDLVVQHAAWDSQLMFEHPEWFLHDDSGAIVSPSAERSDVAALNMRHHELRKYMIRMAEYWVREVGIDGFHCESADRVPLEFWELLRTQLEKIKPVLLLSDGSLPEHHVEAFDITYGGTLYRVFEALVEGRAVPQAVHESVWLESLKYPRGSLRLRYYTHHDLNAAVPAVARFGLRPARLLAVLAFTLPGIPLIYGGEEAGNANRLGLFDASSIDWTDRHGFRALFEKLGRMRKEFDTFRDAPYRPMRNSEPDRVLSFARIGNDRVGVVVANCSMEPVNVKIDWKDVPAQEWREINSDDESRRDVDGSYRLPGWGWKLFIGSRTPS